MKKFFAITGILVGIFALIGGILIAIGVLRGADGNFKLFGQLRFSYGTPDLVKSDLIMLEDFDRVDINARRAHVEVIKSDRNAVEYSVYSNQVKCEVKDKCFTFKEDSSIFTFWNRGKNRRNLDDTYIRVYVKSDDLSRLTVKSDLGDIHIEGITSYKMSADADLGNVVIENANVSNLIGKSDLGKFSFEGSCTQKMDVDVDTGSAYVSGDLSGDIVIDANMGDVKVTTCYNKDSYYLNSDCDMGSIRIHENGGEKLEQKSNMKIDCDMGSIDIYFVDKK